jgi:hypothetical protein
MSLVIEEPIVASHSPMLNRERVGRAYVSRRLLVFVIAAPWVVVATLLASILFGIYFANEGLKAKDKMVDSAKQQAVAAEATARKAELAAQAATANAAAMQPVSGKPGPWGQMDYRTIRIGLPEEFVFVPPPNQPPVRWFFQGSSKEQAVEFLKSAGITPAQLALVEKAKWTPGAQGTAVEPGDEFILSLATVARAKIYEQLVEFDENSRQIDPVWFEAGKIDERMRDSGLAPSSVQLLKSLLYPQGPELLLFADFEPALRHLPNDQERRLFMNAVSRKRTLLAGLHITSESNMESIVNYWGVGGRKKDVGPLLSALRHEGEGKINIICLLPRFAREHIYTYPMTGSAEGTGHKEDCFWSAMNYFNDSPDNRVNDMNYLRDLLKTDYAAINQPTQMGDVIFLATPKDAVIHAAIYIADDIVFTKNGESYTQPWILMHMQDMLDTYLVKHPNSGPMKTIFYRKRTLF